MAIAEQEGRIQQSQAEVARLQASTGEYTLQQASARASRLVKDVDRLERARREEVLRAETATADARALDTEAMKLQAE